MQIDGTPGDDALVGTPQDDTIKGLAGNDTISPGTGIDTIDAGDGDDTIVFRPGDFTYDAQRPTSAANDHVNGGLGNDRIVFDGSQTVGLSGWNISGIETIELVRGAEGALNTYHVSVTDPILVTNGRTLTISGANLGTAFTFLGNGETVDFQGSQYSGRFRVYGGEAGDLLVGGSGSDWFQGGGGADTIDLRGGSVGYENGSDTVVYTNVSQSTLAARDTVQGFYSGDKIDLLGIDAIAGTATDDAFVWSVDETFHNIAGELRFVSTSPQSAGLLEGDTNGDGIADLSIALNFSFGHIFQHRDVIFEKAWTPSEAFDNAELWYAGELEHAALHSGDFNGDGATDFLHLAGTPPDRLYGNPFMVLADPARSKFVATDRANWQLPTGDRYYVGDFDGDGKDDALRYQVGVGNEIHLSTGTTFSNKGIWTDAWSGDVGWYVGDFNGDGKDDMFRYLMGTSGADMWLSDGTKFVSDGSWTTAGFGTRGWTVGDFNGDGMDDAFRVLPGGSGADMWLSTGDGFVNAGSWTAADPGAENWYVGDFNGDGLDDIFRYLEGTSGADVFLSTGSAFVHDSSWTTAGHGPGVWTVGDFNADGSSDLVRFVPSDLTEVFLAV